MGENESYAVNAVTAGVLSYASLGPAGAAFGAALSLLNSGRNKKEKKEHDKRVKVLAQKDAERTSLIEKLYLEERDKQLKANEDAQAGLLARRARARRDKELAEATFNQYGYYAGGIEGGYYKPSGRKHELEDITA